MFSLQGQHLKVILFRHIFKHHICGKALAYTIFCAVLRLHILTKSSNPRRVPLNSVPRSDMMKVQSRSTLLTLVTLHDDPDRRAHAPIDQLQREQLGCHLFSCGASKDGAWCGEVKKAVLEEIEFIGHVWSCLRQDPSAA